MTNLLDNILLVFRVNSSFNRDFWDTTVKLFYKRTTNLIQHIQYMNICREQYMPWIRDDM